MRIPKGLSDGSVFTGIDLASFGGYPDGSTSSGSPGARQLITLQRDVLIDDDGDFDVEWSFISLSTDGTNAGDVFSATNSEGLLAWGPSANTINLYMQGRGGIVGSIGAGYMRWGHEIQCRGWYRPTKGGGGLRLKINGCQIVPDVAIIPTGGVVPAFSDAWQGSRLGVSTELSAFCSVLRAWRNNDPTRFMSEIGVLGDSIMADNSAYEQPAVGMLLYKPDEAKIRGGIYSIAHPGDTASAQKTLFDASPLKTATGVRAFVIQVGVNNVLAGQSAATVLADIQALVTDCAAVAPVILCQMTPCRAALSGGQYAVWQAVNDGINGGGATPITGATRIVTGHVEAMGDGSNNLKASMNSGDNIHPNALGRQTNANFIRNEGLASLGVLPSIGRPPLLGASAWLMPNTQTSGAGASDYFRSIPIPSDVREVTLSVGNRLYSGGAGAPVVLPKIAVGASDGAGGFHPSVAPVEVLSKTVPGDGTRLVLDPIRVSRGTDKMITLGFVYSGGGVATAYAPNLAVGHYHSPSAGVLYPTPAFSGVDDNPLFQWFVSYRSTRPAFHCLGDSILVGGSIPSSACGYLNAAWIKLGLDHDLAVTMEGLPGGFLRQFADPSTYPSLWEGQELRGKTVVIQGGVNDSATDSAAQMLASLELIITHARSLGASRVYVTTILPAGAYGSIAVRDTYNAALLASGTSADHVIDIRSSVWNPANHDQLDAAYDSGDGLHPNTAGNVQIAAAIALDLGL
jgi:lysophospholipase L1-like esterase